MIKIAKKAKKRKRGIRHYGKHTYKHWKTHSTKPGAQLAKKEAKKAGHHVRVIPGKKKKRKVWKTFFRTDKRGYIRSK